MKTSLLILLLAPFFCFAQQTRTQPAENKSSSTDCPTWKKKDVKANKADYFQYLKTSNSKKSAPASTASKENPVSNRQIAKNEKLEVKEKNSTLKKDEKRIENASTVKKNKKSVDIKTSQASVNEDKESVKTVSQKPNPKEETAVATTIVKTDESDIDLKKANKSDTEKNDKLDDEKTKAKQKLTRLTRKTTKVRKHSNSKCPSF